MKGTAFLKIQTNRTVLRPLCMDDLQAAYAWQSCAATQVYNNAPHTDISQTVEYLEWVTAEWQGNHQKYYAFGIEVGGQLIGEIGFSLGCGKCGRCTAGEAAIGYVVHKDFWGNGYEAEVVNAVIKHCFSLGAEKVKLSCDVKDVANLQLIESLGMRLMLENEDCEYSDGRPFVRNTYFLEPMTT